MISPFVDAVRQQVSLVDVVSRYVALKPAGRHFKALCPFHPEKTPSFWVSPDKGLAYCFGCHRGGDVFKFLQEIDGLTFPESVRKLAGEVGMTVPNSFGKDMVPKKERDRAAAANEAAAKFFHERLQSPAGEQARAYLERRGVSTKTIRDHLLGFAPDSFTETHHALIKQGFSHQELLAAGLIAPRDLARTQFLDRFRRRITFPITDIDGKTVGFGARAIDPDDQPKYLNTAETHLFHKGRVLYGLYAARKAIRAKDQVIVVEGYMDVIACHQVGIANVVATNGTALTREHAALLKRFTRNVVLAFDMDFAGQEAAYRALAVVQGMDLELSVLSLPQGKDPDECLRAHPEVFFSALKQPAPFIEYFIDRALSSVDPLSLAGKQAVFRSIFPLLFCLEKAVERDHYVRLLSERLAITSEEVYDALQRFKLPQAHPARSVASEEVHARRYPPEEYLLGLLLQSPAFCTKAQELLAFSDFPEPVDSLYKILIDQYNLAPESSFDQLLASFPEELQERFRPLSLYASIVTDTLSAKQIPAEVSQAMARVKKRSLERQRGNLTQQLRQARVRGDAQEEERLFSAYTQFLATWRE